MSRQSAMAPMGAPMNDLMRTVCTLSRACVMEQNTIRDQRIIDTLETQATAILRRRRCTNKTPPFTFPSEKASTKRRKLSSDSDEGETYQSTTTSTHKKVHSNVNKVKDNQPPISAPAALYYKGQRCDHNMENESEMANSVASTSTLESEDQWDEEANHSQLHNNQGLEDCQPIDEEAEHLFDDDVNALGVPGATRPRRLRRTSSGWVNDSKPQVIPEDENTDDDSLPDIPRPPLSASSALAAQSSTDVVVNVLQSILHQNNSLETSRIDRNQIATLVAHYQRQHSLDADLLTNLQDRARRLETKDLTSDTPPKERQSVKSIVGRFEGLAVSKNGSRVKQARQVESEDVATQLQDKEKELVDLLQRVQVASSDVASNVNGSQERQEPAKHLSKRRSTSNSRSSERKTDGLRKNQAHQKAEMKKLKAAVKERDKEICHLYLQLSAKKKLVQEITKAFVNQIEIVTDNAIMAKPSPPVPAPSPAVPAPDMEMQMFLFRSVVEKQRKVEELNVALEQMEEEVLRVEQELESKEAENAQLRQSRELLSESVRTANAQVVRLQSAMESDDEESKESETERRGASRFSAERLDMTPNDEESPLVQTHKRRHSLTQVESQWSYSGSEDGEDDQDRLSFSTADLRRSSMRLDGVLDYLRPSRLSLPEWKSGNGEAKSRRTSMFSILKGERVSIEEEKTGSETGDELRNGHTFISTAASYCSSASSDDLDIMEMLHCREMKKKNI